MYKVIFVWDLKLLWFPISVSVGVCVIICVCDDHLVSIIFSKVLHQWLSYLDMATMDGISDVSTFGDRGSIFKVTAGINV